MTDFVASFLYTVTIRQVNTLTNITEASRKHQKQYFVQNQ